MSKLKLDEIINQVCASPQMNKIISKYVLEQPLIFNPLNHSLNIHETAVINNATLNLTSGNIEIEEYAFFGHHVSLLTGTHDIEKIGLERQQAVPTGGRDILIKKGAWIASNATIVGPCVIGENAVVGASSLVLQDIPPNTVVAGIPAKIIKTLERKVKFMDEVKINAENIDVEAIMEEIREEIKSRDFDMIPEFKEPSSDAIPMTDKLHECWNVSSRPKLQCDKKIIGPVIVFIKKVIRKLIGWYITPIIEEQNRYNMEVLQMFELSNVQMRRTTDQVQQQEAKITVLRQRQKMYSAPQSVSVEDRESVIKVTTDEEVFDFDYMTFESMYRGSEEKVTEHLARYLPYFKAVDNIIDIGSGRGEFLKLMLRDEKKVLGIEMNQDMVAKSKSEDLPVVYGDGVSYLYEQKGMKIGGVFSAQVVEHLSPAQIVRLIQGAYRNMVDGGVIVLETINPMCLSALSMAYTMDMTHSQPVHPYTLQFILESEGFKNIEIVYLSPLDENPLKLQIDGAQNLDEFNDRLQKLYTQVFGYQDYAIVAYK